MRILLLDNYDSFTYNLFHLIEQFDKIEIDVFRNDEIGIDKISEYDRIVISPGPGLPSDAGITMDVIRNYYSSKKMLGVCLGMQAMAEVFGGKLFNSEKVFHGVKEPLTVIDKNENLFKGLPPSFKTGRYHSWIVDKQHLPEEFKITAEDQNGFAMAMTHENQMLRAVQFHPESILTDFGKELMSNWLIHC
jgi:anthranilate synthase component 2